MGVSQLPETLIVRPAAANFAGVSSINPVAPSPQKKRIMPRNAIKIRITKSRLLKENTLFY
tara:strand:+ start:106 stop:288 length:183 start_codon:yes stop_codon:yes gene_type:complete